jgi:hypothetical protein
LACTLVADRAVLVPTAEEDPRSTSARSTACLRRQPVICSLTPEEQALVGSRAPATTPAAVIGSGVDPAPAGSGHKRLAPLGITDPFVLHSAGSIPIRDASA